MTSSDPLPLFALQPGETATQRNRTFLSSLGKSNIGQKLLVIDVHPKWTPMLPKFVVNDSAFCVG